MASWYRLPISGTTDYAIIQTVWNEDALKIELVDLRNASEWGGEILMDDLRTSALELEIPFEEFLTECKSALCTNEGLTNFKYTFGDTSFILKKVNQFTETYFIVPLVEHQGLSKRLLLESTNLMEAAKKQHDAELINYQTLDMEFKMVSQSFEKLVAEKDKIEKEQLKKCSILLNSKKAKIAELQELLSERRQLSEDSHVESSKSAQNKAIDTGYDELTQEFPLTPVLSKRRTLLPKRKNLIPPVKIIEKQAKASEQGHCAEIEKPRPESEKSLNSQNMFDAM